MPLLPTDTAPFGILEPLHASLLANTEQITWSNAWTLFLVPLVPLYLQALLLRRNGTRGERAALAVLGLGLMWFAGTRYRFLQPHFNAFNDGLGIAYMALTVRYIEFGLIKNKLVDPYWEDRGRHWSLAALDIAANARWIGLGSVDLDSWEVVNDATVARDVQGGPDGSVESGGKTIPRNRTYPPWVSKPPSKLSRAQALTRHALIVLKCFVVVDILLALLREFGADTIGSTEPVPDALYRFSHETTLVVFPKLFRTGLAVPWWAVEIVTVSSVAICVWLALSMGYHFVAAVSVGTRLHDPEAWEVDLFDEPLKSDSLLQFWGRRWHQFFRHHFTLLSTLVLRALNLPPTSSRVLTLSFFFSGAMHSLGQYLMHPVPALLPIFLIFPLSGLGCALEVAFKRLTGKKVHGLWGRAWTWAWMLSTGRYAAIAWFESGVGGSQLCPSLVGEYLKPWLLEWVVDCRK